MRYPGQRRPKSRRGAVLAAIAAVLGAASASAAENPSADEAKAARAKALAEICAQTVCRTETRELRLRTPEGLFVTATEGNPYVHDGSVVLYPGDAVVVDFAADGSMADMPHFSRLSNAPVDVAAPLEGRAIVSLDFSQRDDQPDMNLVLKSGLAFALKYDAYMFVPTRDGVRSGYTSSCTLAPGLTGYEHWPHAIVMIVLTNFRVAPAGDFSCR